MAQKNTGFESDLDSRSGLASEALWISRSSSGKWVQDLKLDYDFRMGAWHLVDSPEFFPPVWSHCCLPSSNYILCPSPTSPLPWVSLSSHSLYSS